MSGEIERSESSASEAVVADAAPAPNGAKAKKASCSSSSRDSPVLASQKTEPAVNAPVFVESGADSPKVGKKELPPPVPFSPTVEDAKAEKKDKQEDGRKEEPEPKKAPASKLSAVAQARAAMLSGGSRGGGGGRASPSKSGVPITDVRKRALASHQMMQAWGKKKRGPRAENQFLKIERNEAEAYALDTSMRLYMELIRGLDGSGDVARCCISAEETRKLRSIVMDTLEKNLDSVMKEFCIEVPDPEHSKKAEEEKLKGQAETASADLEQEEARERDWEKKEALEAEAKGLSSSADGESSAAAKEEASPGQEGAASGQEEENVSKSKSAAESKNGDESKTPADSGKGEVEKIEPADADSATGDEDAIDGKKDSAPAEEEEPTKAAADDSRTSDKESPESTKEEGNASDEDESDDTSDKRKRKSRRKKAKKTKKEGEDVERKTRAVSREPSAEDVSKDDIAEDGGSEVSKETKSDAKKRKRKKESSRSAEEPPLRSAGDSKARKKKRSRRLSTSAIAAVFVSSNSKSTDEEKAKKEKREKKEKQEKQEIQSDADPAPSPTLSRAANESGDLKRKHRFPGAGSLGRLLKKTNSKLDNSSAIEESREPKKGRGRDRKKAGRRDEEGSGSSDSPAKRGTFQRPTLSKDGSSAGSRGRNRQRSAAGRPMLTRGGTGAKLAGPTVPMITLKRNMVDVEQLNSLLEEAVKQAFTTPSRIAADYCPHDEGELDYYFLSLQGPRAANEDEYCVVEHVNEYFGLPEETPNYSFFGVYDGHSGKFGSIYTRSQLISQIFHHPDFHTDPDKAFNDAFLLTDKLINDIEERENFDCGTTAISCCIRDHKDLLISNVGDCEGFTCRAGEPVRMAIAHRPSDEAEKARIKALGGAVVWFGTWRVNGMLAVSRSLGDHSVKNLVIAQPDTSRLEVTPEDEFLVCASDGIWDVLDFPGAIEVVYKTLREGKGRKACCKEICEEALRRGTKDNVTVVVIFFRKEVAGLSFEEQVKC